MASISAFITKFPEFARAGTALVQAHLDAAALEIDTEIFATLADEAIYYLAAHRLALSPYGQTAKLVAEGKRTTTYQTHFRELQEKCCRGAWTL